MSKDEEAGKFAWFCMGSIIGLRGVKKLTHFFYLLAIGILSMYFISDIGPSIKDALQNSSFDARIQELSDKGQYRMQGTLDGKNFFYVGDHVKYKKKYHQVKSIGKDRCLFLYQDGKQIFQENVADCGQRLLILKD